MIWIIGPGAMGSALARSAQELGTPVLLLGRNDPAPSSESSRPSQIWLTCKRGQLDPAIRQWGAALRAHPDAPLMLIQNGLGLGQQCNEAGLARDWTRAACWWGARFDGGGLELTPLPRKITFAGRVDADFWSRAGFETEVFDRLESEALEWRKALTNLSINALLALHRVPNGALLRNIDWITRARVLHLEARAVAHHLGIPLQPESQSWDDVLRTAQNTPKNRNSLLQDLEAGREWELPWLNEWLVAQAARLGVEVPQNAALVAALESLRTNLK